MTSGPPSNQPPSGESGLPDLGTLDLEVTSTRQTETQANPLGAKRPSARPILTVLTGFDAGKVISVVADMVVGRAAECRLVLSDPGVSRAHARIARRASDLVIHDLGSKNGTSVGDDQVGAGGRALETNDVVSFGPHVRARFALVTETEERLARELYDSSMRDPLTRVYNRRYLANRLQAEVAYVLRHGGALSVITFDFDHFKKLNDRYGHAVGDEVLAGGAALVATTLRSEDVLARIGGEEFVIVLRGIGREAAVKCAERVRSAIEKAELSTARATISSGVATSDEVDLDAAGSALLKLSDTRLYAAKAAGRNRVVGGT